MTDDVKLRAKYLQKRRKSLDKFDKTGNKRYQDKADYCKDMATGYTMRIKNPATTVDINQTSIKDSFKSSKDTTYGINNPKTTIDSRKKVSKVKNVRFSKTKK